VLVTEAARLNLETVLTPLADTVPVYVCEPGDLLGITGYNLHRGCLALAERPPENSLSNLLLQSAQFPARRSVADGRKRAVVVVLEGVADAGNVGSVFRNAAAFGAGAVLLSPGSCDPLYRKAIRTSMAATLRVPFARVVPWPQGLDVLRSLGFAIVALTPREPSVTLDAFVSGPHAAKVALLVGTEGHGLTPSAEAAADARVRIPISREVDSLNLAVAVGIALHGLSSPGQEGLLESG
jgi:tRNA G18 (ribose-2'-O)-methylase SpoU